MADVISVSGNFFKTDSDREFYYVVGENGLVIFEKSRNIEVAYATLSGGFTDVWTDDRSPFVFLSTSGAGVYRLEKSSTISGNVTSNLSVHISTPELVTDEVLSISGFSGSHLLLGTISGVEFVTPSGIFTSEDLKPVTSVSLLDPDSVYYAGNFGFGKKNGPISSDWEQADLLFFLDTLTVPALTALPITDIDVIRSGDEITLAIASVSGITIIREKSEQLIRSSSVLQLFRS